MKIDEKYGYIIIDYDDLSNVSIFFGGRGIGKTYSLLKTLLENHVKFIWLRESDAMIKKILGGGNLFAPVMLNCPELGFVDQVSANGSAQYVDENNDIVGYLMALSTFKNARGVDFSDVNCIVFDEFIPEKSNTLIERGQGDTFLNMYESVNRNREIENKPPCKIVLLTNTNKIYSEVLESLGLNEIVEDMQRKGKKIYQNDDILIQFLESKIFEKKKANTLLYRISNNEKFKDMALHNKFTEDTTLIDEKPNMKGARAIISIDNRYIAYQLNSGVIYWKRGHNKTVQDFNTDNKQEKDLFKYLFYDTMRPKYIAGRVKFDSLYTQRYILDLL